MIRLKEKGHTLVEMCIAMVIMALTAQMLAMTILVMARAVKQNEERRFASIKGLQMFNELQVVANRNPGMCGWILDPYSDGTKFSTVLTTDKLVTAPDDPLSGNTKINGHWRYLKMVQVSHVSPNNYQDRQVAIIVTRCEDDGNTPTAGLLLSTTIGTVSPGTSPTCFQTPAIRLPSPNL